MKWKIHLSICFWLHKIAEREQAANERSENIVRLLNKMHNLRMKQNKSKWNPSSCNDNAAAAETEELKNKTRLPSTFEINNRANYIDNLNGMKLSNSYVHSNKWWSFPEIVEKALGESVHHHAEDDTLIWLSIFQLNRRIAKRTKLLI